MISKRNGQGLTHHHVLVRRVSGGVLCLKLCVIGSGNIWNKFEGILRNEPTCLEIKLSIRRCDRLGGKIPHILEFRTQHRELHGTSKVQILKLLAKLIICKYISFEDCLLICQIHNLIFARKVLLNFHAWTRSVDHFVGESGILGRLLAKKLQVSTQINIIHSQRWLLAYSFVLCTFETSQIIFWCFLCT